MKKTLILITLFIGALAFSSCDDKEDEWNRFYGFTKADVVGHYEANPDEDCYPELPTGNIEVYRNVTIDINDMGQNNNLVSLHIVIPDIINVSFTGAVQINGNDSDMAFHNGTNEDILMTVYKNGKNQVRFHGRERRCSGISDGELVNCKTRGFDVIKQ